MARKFNFKDLKMIKTIMLQFILFDAFFVAANYYSFSYNKFKDYSVFNTTANAISSSTKKSNTLCLFECNLNTLCLTAVYIQSFGNTPNCFLFNKSFNSSQKIISVGSSLHGKISR